MLLRNRTRGIRRQWKITTVKIMFHANHNTLRCLFKKSFLRGSIRKHHTILLLFYLNIFFFTQTKDNIKFYDLTPSTVSHFFHHPTVNADTELLCR